MKQGLPRFAAALREIRADEFTPARLNPILSSLDLIASSVEPYMSWRPGAYTRNLVYGNSQFDLMVLCWNGGSVSPIHDHAGQQCWFVTHSGSFKVENYTLVSGGREPGHAIVRETSVLDNVTVGMPDYRSPDVDEIHRVSVAAGIERAVSIHVYAKPFSECLTFDPQAQRCDIKPMAYVNVKPEQILVA